MSVWEEYADAARRLDAVRRSAAAAAAEQAAMARTARDELAGVHQRLTLQQARFSDVATRHGVPLPALTPTPAEVNGAVAPEAGPAAVLAALHHARSTLDAADAELSTVDSAGSRADRPPGLRNLPVYGAFAAVTLVLQVILFFVASEQSLPALAPVCGIVLPALGFALGWLTIGLVHPARAGGRVDRTPLIGAVVCLVLPLLVTCVAFGIFVVMVGR